jgi:hypothetical protein
MSNLRIVKTRTATALGFKELDGGRAIWAGDDLAALIQWEQDTEAWEARDTYLGNPASELIQPSAVAPRASIWLSKEDLALVVMDALQGATGAPGPQGMPGPRGMPAQGSGR